MKYLIVCFLMFFLQADLFSCSIGETGYVNYVDFLEGGVNKGKVSKIKVEVADYQRPIAGTDSCSNVGYLTIAIFGVNKESLYSFSIRSEGRVFSSFEKEKGAYRGFVDDKTGAVIFNLRMATEKDAIDFLVAVDVMEFDVYGSLIGVGDVEISSKKNF
ncbi:hypothetical protein [Vandammella animalimorsus]|uniref:hypothetical protein n=1 Tax=Vandammella animalimorsus TaxID=2029117 RepID=UPI0011775618|nr:hypothetical protein [Vandammella animalimorsus]